MSGTLLFRTSSRRAAHIVGEGCRVGDEEVDADQQVASLQRRFDLRRVGEGAHGVAGDDDESADAVGIVVVPTSKATQVPDPK